MKLTVQYILKIKYFMQKRLWAPLTIIIYAIPTETTKKKKVQIGVHKLILFSGKYFKTKLSKVLMEFFFNFRISANQSFFLSNFFKKTFTIANQGSI